MSGRGACELETDFLPASARSTINALPRKSDIAKGGRERRTQMGSRTHKNRRFFFRPSPPEKKALVRRAAQFFFLRQNGARAAARSMSPLHFLFVLQGLDANFFERGTHLRKSRPTKHERSARDEVADAPRGDRRDEKSQSPTILRGARRDEESKRTKIAKMLSRIDAPLVNDERCRRNEEFEG
mmetsp:Transcript_36202/g.108447  ORF Transcript_36202/g.108447 Transcript_36202/m.108447 type:complete len:184 (+) Transcript_36202:788-1339(+)